MLNVMVNVYTNMVPEFITVMKNTDVSFHDMIMTGKLVVNTLVSNRDIIVSMVKKWF